MATPRPSHAFISYSQKDSRFVQKLAVDLKEAELPVQFDQWGLRAGDSLLDRIALLIDQAFLVVCVVSKNSIESKWVAVELELAHERGLPVVAIAIDDAFKTSAKLRKYVAETLIVDGRENYYSALRSLLERLGRDLPEEIARPALAKSKDERGQLLNAIDSGDPLLVRDLVSANPVFALRLFRRWAVHELIPRPRLGGRQWDAVIVNGQSGRYDCIVVHFADTSTKSRLLLNDCFAAAKRLNKSKALSNDLKRMIAMYLRSGYGAHQILEWDRRPLNVSHLIFHGRRAEYDKIENEQRLIWTKEHSVEVASYDRLASEPNSQFDAHW